MKTATSGYVGRTITIILAVMLGSLLIWGVGVATSRFFGRGNQIKQINRWENQTYSQEHFETLYGDILAYDQQIGVLKAIEDPSAQQQTNLQGLKLICISTVQTYNADAKKVSVGAFRSTDLPSEVSTFDEATDCE